MLIAIQSTILKSHPIDSQNGVPDNFQSVSISKNSKIEYNWIRPAENKHWVIELKSPQLGRFNWYVFRDHVKVQETKSEIIADLPNANLPKLILFDDWKNPSAKISKYFSVGEVTKNDSRRIPIAGSAIEKNILALARELDKIREDWDSAIIVTSWYRPLMVNRSVGSNDDSQHIQGRAVDIKPANKDLVRFQSWLDQFWFGALGYGAKKGFVHLDTRNGKGWKDSGKKGVRWYY